MNARNSRLKEPRLVTEMTSTNNLKAANSAAISWNLHLIERALKCSKPKLLECGETCRGVASFPDLMKSSRRCQTHVARLSLH